MKIMTTRFGEVDIDDESIINFVDPIIGYEEFRSFTLIEQNNSEYFKWLQSIENPELAFPTTNPVFFGIDYTFEIANEIAQKINLTDGNSAVILNIVTIPNNNPNGSTVNLLAPIVVNSENNQAMQIILSDSGYPIRQPLFKTKV